MAVASTTPSFDLWAKLSEREAAQLRACLTEQQIPAGMTFIREREPGDCLYVVRSGEVEVRRADRLLARLGAGHVVGEMALLNREPRNADVVAVTDCTLSRLNADDFDKLSQRLPGLNIVLTRLVAHRLNWSGADVVARRIGPYEVVEQLGAGNMGWVFRAVRGEEQFAVKMLPHPLVQHPRFLERYRQEANLLREIDHENIVGLREMIELYGTVFLVLEYVRGANVEEWIIWQGRPDAQDVRCVTLSVARGLQAAHEQAVVHCDVKPSNIMISADGVVKLVDFGIARSLDEPASTSELTLTPSHAAPERFTGARGSPESDFYSLGVTVYELLTGELPFSAESIYDWGEAHREQTPLPLRERQPDAPQDLADFVDAALIKDPHQRQVALQPCLRRWTGDTTHLTVNRPPSKNVKSGAVSFSKTIANAPTIESMPD